MRPVYGVDPEALGLAGPNAMGQAFSASLQGMTLGEQFASNALRREAMREQMQQIEEDRLTRATLSPGGVGGAAAAPQRRSRGSEAPAGVVGAGESFGSFLRPQLRADSAIEDVNATLADYDDARAAYGQAGGDPPRAFVDSPAGSSGPMYSRQPREQGGFDVSGPANPLTRVGYVSDVLPTPDEAALAIRRRAGEYALSEPEMAALVQDYENFYTQRMGQYEDSMSAMMQRQAEQQATAAAQQDAAIQRGAEIANAIRFNGYSPTAEDLPYLGLYNRLERQAYEAPTGQAADIQQSRIAATPGTIRANTERNEAQADRALLEQARARVFSETLTRGLEAGLDRDAATRAAAVERDKIIDPATAKQYFAPEDATTGPALTEQEVVTLLKSADAQAGTTRPEEEYSIRARGILSNPSAVARLSRVDDGSGQDFLRALLGGAPPRTAPAASQPAPAPAMVRSQAEYDALPSGAEFIDADDGRTYRKP